MHSTLDERIDTAARLCSAGYHSNNTNEEKKENAFFFLLVISRWWCDWKFSLLSCEGLSLLLLLLLGIGTQSKWLKMTQRTLKVQQRLQFAFVPFPLSSKQQHLFSSSSWSQCHCYYCKLKRISCSMSVNCTSFKAERGHHLLIYCLKQGRMQREFESSVFAYKAGGKMWLDSSVWIENDSTWEKNPHICQGFMKRPY